MNTRNIALLFTMTLLAGCSAAPIGIEVGADGTFAASVRANDTMTRVAGRDGGLFINSEARGDVREGDWVTIDWDGTVHVNGKPR